MPSHQWLIKQKTYTRHKIIHFKYISEFFGNFHMTHSLGIMLEVKNAINLLLTKK